MSVLLLVCLALGILVLVILHPRRSTPRLYTPPEIKMFDLGWTPLVLSVDLGVKKLDDRIEKSIVSAANYWNEKTGMVLFAPPGSRCVGSHTVLIMPQPDEPVRERSVVYTRCYTDETGSLCSATIYVKPEAKRITTQELDRVFTHALGHCLGLTHDGIHGSVMYGDELDGVYAVLDRDVNLLRSVYGVRSQERGPL